jgi:hypothetical protein
MIKMKNITNSIKLLIICPVFALLFVSCEYQEIADAEYPEQVLYMPSAIKGVFKIDNVPQRMDFHPTPDQPYNFIIDPVTNKFIVPLSVYRAGINRSGKVIADISINTDTVTQLTGSLLPETTVVLPGSTFSVPSSVEVPDGTELIPFSLEIDLDYLKSFPDAAFGIGVGISSSQAEVNPKLNTTVIVIYTKLLFPAANFSSSIDATNKNNVKFVNSSSFAMTYSWDFGDGTTSAEKSPNHEYASEGTYNVTLSATGVLGPSNLSMITKPVTIVP